ncbi:MAG: M23 family metallopeptidase [Bacteroidetes bacterium]|nr:M23 family metallopeptidase [Bacteroidota bacterium]MCY4225176.1 M23 family metallopeptidase [Bacteroidota bacterium]
MIFRKYKTDPFTLERVPVPLGFFKPWLLVLSALVIIVTGWLTLDLLSISPQEQILIAENQLLQEEIMDSYNRVTNLAEQIDDLAETDQELYRLILQTDTIPSDVRQLGVGGTDPYGYFDGFSQSTASLLRNHVELLDELERKVALQKSSYQVLMPLGVKKRRQLAQLPTIQPTIGTLSSTYGSRLHPILHYRRMHTGVDISVPNDSPVYATGGGTIELIDYDSGYGNYIVIDHPAVGYKTLYGHLNSVMPRLNVGDEVVRGQQIALSGNTGLSTAPHVHYEVRDHKYNPLDPINFFGVSMTPEEYRDFLDHAKNYAHLPSLD